MTDERNSLRPEGRDGGRRHGRSLSPLHPIQKPGAPAVSQQPGRTLAPPSLVERSSRPTSAGTSEPAKDDHRLTESLSLLVGELRGQVGELKKEVEILRRREASWNAEREALARENERLRKKLAECSQVAKPQEVPPTVAMGAAGPVDFSQGAQQSGTFAGSDWGIDAREDGTLVLTPVGAVMVPNAKDKHAAAAATAAQPLPAAPAPQAAPTTSLSWKVQQEGEHLVVSAEGMAEMPGAASSSTATAGSDDRRAEAGSSEAGTGPSPSESRAKLDKNMRLLRKVVLVFTKSGVILSPAGVLDMKKQLQATVDAADAAQEEQRIRRPLPSSVSGTTLPIVTPAGTLT